MDDQWIVLRTTLCLKNPGNRHRIQRICRQTVNGFRGDSYNFTGTQQRSGLFQRRRILRRAQKLGLHRITFCITYSSIIFVLF